MRPKPGLLSLLLVVLALLLTTGPGAGQDKAPVYSAPLGIALEEYPYPYPVQFLTLNIAGLQLLCSAHRFAVAHGKELLLTGIGTSGGPRHGAACCGLGLCVAGGLCFVASAIVHHGGCVNRH